MAELAQLLEKTVPALGYELVDWEFGPGRLLRVFIDKPAPGVDVEDCAKVSNQLTRLFDVEGIDFARLEVSSPGLDRPLRKASDFERFAGQEAKLTLREPIDKSRKLKGILRGVDGQAAVVETTAGTKTVPLDMIERARLVPRIEWRKS
ncbi:MAG: ribosome maturation factor RimP [Proteobacteria bacterium]|nr:ribosome maturation factor RimP [Pseudomonadota bacterium]